MLPSIDVWTELQFASFCRIFSQSLVSTKGRPAFRYILINTAGFAKIGLLLPNHHSSCHSIPFTDIRTDNQNSVAVLYLLASNTYICGETH